MGQEWDIPRFEAWQRTVARLPPLQIMVGKYLGYKVESPDAEKSSTPEEHAARLIEQLTGFLSGN